MTGFLDYLEPLTAIIGILVASLSLMYSLLMLRRSEKEANVLKQNLSDLQLELRKASLEKAELSIRILRSDVDGQTFKGADLSRLDLSGANLKGFDFSQANMSYCDLSNTSLKGASLRNTLLRFADISDANLSDSDLSFTMLTNCDLSSSNLSNAIMHNTKLNGVDLRGANLSNTQLLNVTMDGVIFDENTSWPEDFDVSKLESTRSNDLTEAKTFSELFRDYRMMTVDTETRRPLTQSQIVDKLADETGLVFSPATISSWERGKYTINPNDRALLVSLIKVFHQYGAMSNTDSANQLLEAGNYRKLSHDEIVSINPDWFDTITSPLQHGLL